MPIYAYRCSTCGHAKDVLQKMSDPVLTVCPACGASTFQKQVTAAGFQLKGSGWYVTDFRGGDSAQGGKKAEGEAAPSKAGDGGEAPKTGEAAAPAPAAAAPAPSPATPSGSSALSPAPAAPPTPASGSK